jgi:2,3,4,5-tetrahydropyridine-2,6-dicarboxylate N-succinyltransferase
VYEGTIVKKRAVLGSGTVLNASKPVYDLVRDTVYAATDEEPLVIPEEAIVVPGARDCSTRAAKSGTVAIRGGDCEVSEFERDARVRLQDYLR